MRYFSISGTSEQMGEFQRKVGIPLDDIFEKVESVLDTFPEPFKKVNVVLCNNAEGVQKIYQERYGKPCKDIAFISLGRMDIVISVEDASLRVFAHEVGHAVVEQYFNNRPSYVLHELMAQYCEKHIKD
jgi:hypothetical protein